MNAIDIQGSSQRIQSKGGTAQGLRLSVNLYVAFNNPFAISPAMLCLSLITKCCITDECLSWTCFACQSATYCAMNECLLWMRFLRDDVAGLSESDSPFNLVDGDDAAAQDPTHRLVTSDSENSLRGRYS